MAQPSQAPGWYPDPSDAGRQIYWDGSTWVKPTANEDKSSAGKRNAIAAGVFVLVAIGLFMSMQSVSLLSGSGPVWTGVGVVAAGTAVAFFLGASKAVRVVAALCLVLALSNAFYIEKQMSDKRDEIGRMFSSYSS